MDYNFILPKLRDDITVGFFNENGEQLAILSDPAGYAPQSVAFPKVFYDILLLIDGKKNLNEIIITIKFQLGLEINPDILVEILQGLNNQFFLETPNFHFAKFQSEFYKTQPVRPPACVGNSYPAEPAELEITLDKILSTVNKKSIKGNAKFIISPHIDYNLGLISHEVYASAYHAIRDSDADLFVIFGTAHHISSDIFMLSEKDFATPLGLAQTDKIIIEDLKTQLPGMLTIDENAHRYEHSIELQLLMLQYIFKDRNFTILPILTGTYHNYILKSLQPNSDEKFFNFLSALKIAIERNNKKALFIAGGDLAHIGRKFQDNFDAEPILTQLKKEDDNLINQLVECKPESFFNEIATVNDKRKICGLSPFYSLLEIHRNQSGEIPFKGKFLKYNQWNEIETRSAVSFASIAFYPL